MAVERRYITIPETMSVDVTQRDGSTRPGDLPFVEFIMNVLLKDPKFGAKIEILDIGIELRALFRDAEPGDELELRKTDWQVLSDVCRAPTTPFNPEVLYQIREKYVGAILDAPSKSPTKEKDEEKPGDLKAPSKKVKPELKSA